jgi:glycosyltransferase Alg8
MSLHLLYLAVWALIVISIPATALDNATGLIITIGAIGLWRYCWVLTNFARALYYIRRVYPKRREKAASLYARRANPAHAFFVVTTYKIDTATTAAVYRSVLLAASQARGGATVIASVVDAADERLIRKIFAREPADSLVTLIIDRIAGTGKRDALSRSLGIIATHCPTEHDIVILVDGDTCVPFDVVARTAPFFTLENVGALTTDERCEIRDRSLFRDWYGLRFTQRQLMMSSLALGGRVLTLTGRMSVIRADIAARPDFISTVKHDCIEHWRLGRVNFLTGDDKSTWFWLLKNGYEMAYMPDLQSVSMEKQPRPTFISSAQALMIRWFGNMLRTNGRALRQPPSRIGLFTWWSLLDQRVSIWTTLAGPISVALTAIFVEPMILAAYLAWVMITRYAYCCMLTAFRRPFPITYPLLLYFNQVFGSILKSYVLFRLDRQKWTRQSTTLPDGERGLLPLKAISSSYLHALAYGWLVTGLWLVNGLYRF